MALFANVKSIAVDERSGIATFSVILSQPAVGGESFSYSYTPITARNSNSADYAATNGMATFMAGQTVLSLSFNISDDLLPEQLESLLISFTSSDAESLVFTNTNAVATIVDNDQVVSDANANGVVDAAEKAVLSVRDIVVDETAGTATFDVLLNRATTNGFTVAYFTASESAQSGKDFTAATGSLSFEAGQTSKQVTVSLMNDSAIEINESFSLNLGDVTGNAANEVLLGDSKGTALIYANDRAAVLTPQVSVLDAVVIEGQGYVDIVVALSAPGTSEVSVDYTISTMAGTDTATESNGVGGDYVGPEGKVTFAPGETVKTVRVVLRADSTAEAVTEQFTVSLINAVGATLLLSSTKVLIADDDIRSIPSPQANGLSNDTYFASTGNDVFLEASYGGNDTVSYAHAVTGSTGVTVSLAKATASVPTAQSTGGSGTDLLRNIENLIGSNKSDNLTGSTSANLLQGGAGDDRLEGLAGNDTLNGGQGVDMLSGGAGNDNYVVDNARDVVSEYRGVSGSSDAGGVDTIQSSVTWTLGEFIENLKLTGVFGINGTGNSLDNRITGNSADNQLSGMEGNDILDGGDGADQLSGGDGNDRLSGGLGGDVMFGGLGNDTYEIDSLTDSVVENSNETEQQFGGIDTIEVSLNRDQMLEQFVENLVLTGAAIFGQGNSLNNTLAGNHSDNFLSGLSGNDILMGGAGDDTLNRPGFCRGQFA